MEPGDDPYQQQRSTCLPWMLGIFLIGFFVVMLVVATGGFFIYVLGVIVGVVMVSALHYALWGHGLDDTAAEERAEDAARAGELDDGQFSRPPDS